MNENKQHTFAEIYPIIENNIPRLIAYSLDVGGGQLDAVGGKIAYRLKKQLGGHWTFADKRVITDKTVSASDLEQVVRGAWKTQGEVYRNLHRIDSDETWKPSSYAKARFVSTLVESQHRTTIEEILSKSTSRVGPVIINRIHEIRPWVIQGKPALSVSISSRLILSKDLHEYELGLADKNDLLGLWVADKNTTFKGEIRGIVGKLKDHRSRLLLVTQTEKTSQLLETSPDDTLVVAVGRDEYEYAATCLWPIVKPQHYERFGIRGSEINRYLRIRPDDRYRLVQKIALLIRMNKWIGFEYSTKTHPGQFLMPSQIGFNRRVRIGNGQTVNHGRDIFYNLKEHGLYQYRPDLQNGTPIKAAIVKSSTASALDDFNRKVGDELNQLGLQMDLISEETIDDRSPHAMESALDSITKLNPDIVFGVFSPGSSYYRFKDLTIGRGIASQVVHNNTIRDDNAIPNIVLGVVGKTGNTPYILEKPLPYTDILVGVDVAREKKKNLSGTINIAAIARIYFSNGQFVRYVLHDKPIEGETIPIEVIRSMLPASEFRDKRVIVHRDSYFRGDEVQVLADWGEDIGATVYPVEVIKSGAPRLYGAQNMSPRPSGIERPIVGSSMLINSKEAILASTPPPGKNSTPQPLRIRTRSALSIENALHSVLSLTLLHYGSVNPPRLPVTVHYSDKIAGLALNGVRPRELEGDRLYWL